MTIKTFLTAMSLLLVLSFACQVEDSQTQLPEPETISNQIGGKGRGLEIAHRNSPGGDLILHADRLVKKLTDGTPVRYFAIRNSPQGYSFARIGVDAEGNYKSESFQTVASPMSVKLAVIDQLVWFVSCDKSKCSGCLPSRDGSRCECDAWTDGVTVYDHMGNEIGTLESGGSGGVVVCNLGIAGGGLFPTKVFQ